MPTIAPIATAAETIKFEFRISPLEDLSRI
jgi:hypothetical protein